MIGSWRMGLLCALLTGCAAKVGEPTSRGSAALSSKCTPAVPSALQVPAGNRLEMSFDAIGVQIYDCQATSASSFGWVFQAPQATLYNEGGQIAGTHYAGPTWAANDGSTVVGAKLATYTADPNSIPWLLLRAVSHSGNGRMTPVTYVQRLDTVGGTAPASGCDAAHVGDVARVGYTATYFFYEASHDGDDPGGDNEGRDCQPFDDGASVESR